MSDSISINSSPLFFGPLTETNFGGILKEKFPYSKFVILTDENVAEHWVEYLTTEFDSLHGCEIIQLPPGEENKNILLVVVEIMNCQIKRKATSGRNPKIMLSSFLFIARFVLEVIAKFQKSRLQTMGLALRLLDFFQVC